MRAPRCRGSPPAQLIADPQSDGTVAAAIDRTFAVGGPERWHSHGLSGYAVAGQASADGCKLVSVAINEAAEADIPPLERCPQ